MLVTPYGLPLIAFPTIILYHAAKKIKWFSPMGIWGVVYIAVPGYPASAILPPWVVPTAFLFVHRPCVEQVEGLQGEMWPILSEPLEAGLSPCSAFIRARGGAACRPFSFFRCSCFRGAKSSAGRQAHISGLVRVRRVRAPEAERGQAPKISPAGWSSGRSKGNCRLCRLRAACGVYKFPLCP